MLGTLNKARIDGRDCRKASSKRNMGPRLRGDDTFSASSVAALDFDLALD